MKLIVFPTIFCIKSFHKGKQNTLKLCLQWLFILYAGTHQAIREKTQERLTYKFDWYIPLYQITILIKCQDFHDYKE